MSDLPRTCQRADGQRKLIYPTRTRARSSARRFERARGHRLRVYHCPNCGFFHIASLRVVEEPEVRDARVLLVGEAPNRTTGHLERPGLALTGASGRRLADLAGVSVSSYLRRTSRVNLLDDWPGESWPTSEARMAALRILPQLAGRRTILVGSRVAKAFGVVPWQPFAFDVRFDMLVPDAEVAMIPHPSGRSRWWNDPRNVERAREFLRSALAAPVLPSPGT